MDKLETEKNVTSPTANVTTNDTLKRKSLNGEVAYEVSNFDEYLSGGQGTHGESSSILSSHSFNFKWAKGHLEIKSRDDGSISVLMKLEDLNPECSQCLCELTCSISITKDTRNLSKSSRSVHFFPISRPSYGTIQTEMTLDLSEYRFLAAAKPLGKASTLRIVVQYEAVGYDRGTPQYNKKLEYPGGICGSPELLEALHHGAESDCLKYMKTIVSDTNVTEFLSSAIKCNAEEAVKELVDWCKKRFWELYRKDEFRAYFEGNLEVFYGGK